jgi:hypothetical protein
MLIFINEIQFSSRPCLSDGDLDKKNYVSIKITLTATPLSFHCFQILMLVCLYGGLKKSHTTVKAI